jgi:hypothetical protein
MPQIFCALSLILDGPAATAATGVLRRCLPDGLGLPLRRGSPPAAGRGATTNVSLWGGGNEASVQGSQRGMLLAAQRRPDRAVQLLLLHAG